MGALRGAVVLLYHRVATVDWDPWQLCVSPSHFAEHLQILRRQATILSLGQLLDALDAGRIPRRAVVLTFDDGYADNLHAAKPLLERYDVPATVFLATGAIDSGMEFWWDEIEQLVQQPEPGARFCLRGDDRTRIVRTAAGRDVAYRMLWRGLQPLRADRRRRALDELWAQTSTRPALRASHRPHAVAQVAELGANGLVSLGAHSVSHPVLPWLPAAEQRAEIEHSKLACEALSGRSAAGFAYPHGEWSAATAGMVRTAGLPCACASDADLAGRRSDRFALPRVPVEDWDGATFERRLVAALQ